MAGVSTYTDKIGIEICTQIASGKPLTKICRQRDMPCLSTVYKWLADPNNKAFSDMYEKAHLDQADTLAAEILEIADDGTNDTYEDEQGREIIKTDVVQRSRLRVDARKWIAAKYKPKKYGEKLMQENTYPDGLPPVRILAVEGYRGWTEKEEADGDGA